uniref:Pts system, IIA component n=1 Tax=uncultured Latescibacterota bacterium TaxID=199737 RepID=Q2Z0E3_9BACT|nr:pts system, IIA component [uncultured Latescibacterota bacterium]
MKLSAFTGTKLVDLSLSARSKDDVLASMVGLIARSPNVTDGARFLTDVLAREKLVTTGVGYGVAFPHAKSAAVKKVVFAFARTAEDVPFEALDCNPVRLIFLIGAPRETEPSGVYLNLMARLSFLMKDEGNRNALLSAGTTKAVFDIFDSVK